MKPYAGTIIPLPPTPPNNQGTLSLRIKAKWQIDVEEIGKRQDLTRFDACDLMLTNKAGFTREQVGKITVTHISTNVTVARNIAAKALEKLTARMVRGKITKVRAPED